MPSCLPNKNPLSYLGVRAETPPNLTKSLRDPTINDNYEIGSLWVNDDTGNSFQLVKYLNGDPVWQDLGGTGDYTITPFVVGPAGQAGYQTIQSAINAANTAGGGTIYIQPGTYTENITLYDQVNLMGFAGESGSIGIYTTAGNTCSVIINGKLTIDTSTFPNQTDNTCQNIQFSPALGDVVTFYTNAGILGSSTLTFINCTLIGTEVGKSIINTDGFPTLSFINCSLLEKTIDTINILTLPGAAKFAIINADNCFFGVNSIHAAVLQDVSDTHFYLTNCVYSSMIDMSSAPLGSFTFDARGCVFSYIGNATAPLINFAAADGNIYIKDSIYLNGTGGFSSSTSLTSTFRIIDTTINDTIKLENNCKDQFYNCSFVTGADPAISMNSASNVTISSSVVDSSNNPSIIGTGAGTLTLSGVSFLSNHLIAGTLTLAGSDVFKAGSLQVIAGTNAPGASPQIVNARQGQAAFTDVIANGAYGTLTVTDSFVTNASHIIATASCTTVNSACSIVEVTPGAGSFACRIFNAGAASTAANILVTFFVLD